MDAVPEVIATARTTWRVRRAWPGDDHVSFEATDSRRLIGGHWDPRAGAELIDPTRDKRLPGVSHLAHGSTVVSYRPGKRAVAYTPDTRQYTKIVRPGRAQRILDGVERGAGFAAAFRTPEVLAHREDAVTFAALSGHTLHDLAPQIDETTWRTVWDRWSTDWVRVVSESSQAPIHGPDDEAEVLHTWIHHLRRLTGPDPVFEAAAAEVVESLRSGSVF